MITENNSYKLITRLYNNEIDKIIDFSPTIGVSIKHLIKFMESDDFEFNDEFKKYIRKIISFDQDAKKHWVDIITDDRNQKINEILK